MSVELKAKPLGDKVLIKVEKQEKTASGIIISDVSSLSEKKIGTVVSVGRGIYTQSGTLIPMEVQVGDKVMLPANSYDTQTVTLEDTEYVLMREGELLMVIR